MDWPTGHAFATALVTGLLLGGLFTVTALGLSLVFGVMRLINLVHGELIVLGAYVALELTRHAGLDPLLTILIAAPLLFLFAVPLHRGLLEPLMAKGPEPALLTTFALSVIGQNLYILIWSGDTQSLQASYATASFSVGSVRIPTMYLISFAIALVLCGGVHLMLQHTGLGREVRASSEDSVSAAGLGVNVTRVRVFVYGLAAACAAVGGRPAGRVGHLGGDLPAARGLSHDAPDHPGRAAHHRHPAGPPRVVRCGLPARPGGPAAVRRGVAGVPPARARGCRSRGCRARGCCSRGGSRPGAGGRTGCDAAAGPRRRRRGPAPGSRGGQGLRWGARGGRGRPRTAPRRGARHDRAQRGRQEHAHRPAVGGDPGGGPG